MIKKVLLILVLFLSISISAQTYFGFKVGANFANFSGDVENNGIKPSFHVGGVVEVQINDFFSVQPEVLFSMQGYQDKDDALLKYNYHYVNVPIMVKYFVNENFSIDAGPQVGMLLAAKISTGTEELTDVKDLSNTFDYGVNLGGSYEMDNGMNINIRYNYGLANVFDNESNDLKANNTVIQVSLGYKFY
ncbi:MAG: PorT family protein [Flavobacteriaceae bacterium]|nr:PorT family protein [Flavobacteriaceae bacterium]